MWGEETTTMPLSSSSLFIHAGGSELRMHPCCCCQRRAAPVRDRSSPSPPFTASVFLDPTLFDPVMELLRVRTERDASPRLDFHGDVFHNLAKVNEDAPSRRYVRHQQDVKISMTRRHDDVLRKGGNVAAIADHCSLRDNPQSGMQSGNGAGLRDRVHDDLRLSTHSEGGGKGGGGGRLSIC